ncbi:MAG: YaaA family protein [Mycoplasmatales bacterium]|nr:YaaA family protein [Mycoplasmatales bacterium]
MKKIIIISPSKYQKIDKPIKKIETRPKTLQLAKNVFKEIKKWNLKETKNIYKLSDKKALEVFKMHQNHGKEIYYAIDCFDGTVFKELNIESYDKEYLNNHLRIIDPLYGILKPYDTIGTYRLDFMIKFPFNLKDYWKETVNEELENYEIINLASKEYSSIVDLPMKEIELEEGNSIKKRRGKTLHRILTNKEI